MNKHEKYQQLVAKRKTDCFFQQEGLINTAEYKNGVYDCNEIGAWSQWHGDLDAKIVIVGQDWGDECYLVKNQGKDRDDNPTNQNLKTLFSLIGFELGTCIPESSHKKGLFFTNAILGIKKGGMSNSVKDIWIRRHTAEYTKELLNIIQPQIIITLGKKAYKSMRYIKPDLPDAKLNELIEIDNIEIQSNQFLFPRYHCGGLGLANRNWEKQKGDWLKILPFLRKK